ncbi:MAG: hydantoinase B/oxoprolinase family protein [SAR202 cluster bacterium]|nr:hydantoinase B/oxoprolinase family protein [SAR202 cluster bacterium]
MPKSKVDPITLEVMRNAFYSISDEMVAALVRASYSTNIKDRRDTSGAIYTATGDMAVVAMSEVATPVHLGTMHSAVKSALSIYPLEKLEQGDAIAFNIPYPAGPGHLNDLALISPVFYKGRVIAITANQAHHVDMGGYAPGSMPFGVTEIFQEGLQIPPVKLFKKGEIDPDLWSLISQNVRPQKEVRGDLMAQFAANVVCESRLTELADKYGPENVELYLDEMLNYSQRRMESALKLIPIGKYSFEDVIEGDGITTDRITIRVTIEAKGDSITTDFTQTDNGCLGPLNCRWPSVAACVYYVLKACLDPDMPANAGSYRPVDIRVREGSLLSAIFPTAVCNANIITTQRIVDVLIGALAKVIPERVAAASSGTMNLLNIGGQDKRRGVYFNYIETYAGGQGAMHDQDGMDAVQNHMTNTRNSPAEVIEVAYPLRIEAYELIPDSEGAGKHRGGVGLRRSIRVLADRVGFTLSSDRAEVAPWGLFGGQDARTSKCVAQAPDGKERRFPSKVTTSVLKDNLIVTETPGGGGWGDAKQRDPEAVRRDIISGVISRDRARDVYAVAFKSGTNEIDEAATKRLRK